MTLKIATFLVKNRKFLFYGMLLLLLVGTVSLPSLKIDNSIEGWFLEDDPALLEYRAFKQQYGNDEVIIAMIQAPNNQVFTPEFLNQLHELSRKIEDNPDIRRVLSIGKSPWIGLIKDEDGDDTLVVEDVINSKLTSTEDAQNTQNKFYDNQLWPKLLLSQDKARAVLIIEPVATDEMDVKRPEILKFVTESFSGFDVHFAGMGVMYEELNRLSMQDSSIFTSLSYVVLLLMAGFLYRSLPLTGILMVVMGASALAFLDIYAAAGATFNMVTIVLPTLIIILSTADVSHVFNHYALFQKKAEKNQESALIEVFQTILIPCFFTSATTCLGFASIYFSRIAILRTFGVFAAICAMLEFFIVMICCAYLLGLLNPTKKLIIHRPFAASGQKMVKFATSSAGRLAIVFVVILLISGIGISKLDVDTYSMGFLKENNPIRMASDKVEEVYGYYLPLEVRLLTNQNNGIEEPDFLNRLLKAESAIEKLPRAAKCASITNVVCRLNLLWTDGKPESYRISDTRLQVHQLLDFYGSDPDNDLKYMTDKNKTEARLTIRIPMVSAANLADIEKEVETVLQGEFAGTSTQIKFGGYVPLYVKLLEYITWSQVTSFSTAIIIIFLLVGLLFMRFSALLLGLVTNITPIVMILGFMGLTAIRLDLATVTIAAITLGIAVDDTIHILYHYFHFRDKGAYAHDAITQTLSLEGSPVIATSVILCAGFAILSLASIKSVLFFGVLIAMTMIFALFADILMLPALITLFNKRRN